MRTAAGEDRLTFVARTPLELVRLAAEHLGQRGVETPRLDAELLLAQVLGVSRIQLYLQFDRPLKTAEVDAYRDSVRRRALREPVAYITGEREFWSLQLAVDPRVLIPRPETETLVESCLEHMGDAGRLVDLGTGSGALALAFLVERPGWTAVGLDCSLGALAVARENALRLGLSDRLELQCGDLFGPVCGEVFSLVVSNPPYIPTAQIDELEPEVARHEPRAALDGGADGLDTIRRIALEAPEFLQGRGLVALEFGVGQEKDVASIFQKTDAYGDLVLVNDYTKRPRAVLARKR